MPCTDQFATVQQFADFWCFATTGASEERMIDTFLDIAASDMHAAMAAVGACDCSLATWATAYLRKLNIIDAMIIHNCPCDRVHITDVMRQAFLEWVNGELKAIRDGAIELCAGHTAAAYPHITWAEQSVTVFNAAKIILNTERRNS